MSNGVDPDAVRVADSERLGGAERACGCSFLRWRIARGGFLLTKGFFRCVWALGRLEGAGLAGVLWGPGWEARCVVLVRMGAGAGLGWFDLLCASIHLDFPQS